MSASIALHHIVLVGFAAICLAAATSDAIRYLIPNRYSIAIILMYPAAVLTAPVMPDWPGAVIASLIVLTAGFTFFAFNLIGGGDVKFLAATALWAGSEHIIPFLISTALVGGGLASFIWLRHRFQPMTADTPAQDGTATAAPLVAPYGVAIAAGALLVGWRNFLGT
jgi:prepilin peptidase CpaA